MGSWAYKCRCCLRRKQEIKTKEPKLTTTQRNLPASGFRPRNLLIGAGLQAINFLCKESVPCLVSFAHL